MLHRRTPGRSHKAIDLWFQLFFDILDDEKLTTKFWNTIKVILGDEERIEKLIVANISERKTSRIQRRKRINGR